MEIRRARISDAQAICTVHRRSVIELCVADHCNDPAILGRFYLSAGYLEQGPPEARFGTKSSYPMAKRLAVARERG